MSEYMIQIAMKVEISDEESTKWDIEDIATVIYSSLLKIHPDENTDEHDVVKSQILHVVEYLKQYPPIISKENVTSYFHRKGTRHWFYIGTTDDTGKAQRYEAASFFLPKINPIGILPLSHLITVHEGEVKVLGHAKFSSLKSTAHHLKKMTMPNEIKELLKTTRTNIPLIIQQQSMSDKTLHKASGGIKKKKTTTMKKSGVTNFLKFIAPGAGNLLFSDNYDLASPSSIQSEDPEEDAEAANKHSPKRF